eukprot:g1695.t1
MIRVSAADSQSRSLELQSRKSRALQQSPTRRYLRKSDLEEKLLITRTTGRKFGIVGEAWVDPRKLTIQNFDVVSKKQIIRTEVIGSISMESIREVGDVVLIHSDRDFNYSILSNRLPLTTLPGLKLVLDNGTAVGKVIDFIFDPESGRIVQLVFHTKNFPFAKAKHFDQFAIPVQNISKIVLSENVVYLKNTAMWKKVGAGEYQFLANFIPSFDQNSDEDEVEAEMQYYANGASAKLQSQYQQLLEESKRQQEAYYATYGQQGPRKSISRSPRDSPMKPKKTRKPQIKIDEWIDTEQNQQKVEEEAFLQRDLYDL